MGLALGAVVELILAQLFLTGEGLQTAVQADGLSLGPTRLLHAAVFFHNLRGKNDGQHSKQGKGIFISLHVLKNTENT